MLGEVPFSLWPVEKSIEDDPGVPLVHYVFPKHGMELCCDLDDRISVIFLFADEFGGFDESLLGIPFSWSRREVIAYFGAPSKSGAARKDPILGEYGPWDRFLVRGYAVRVEYRTDADCIKDITLMREDAIPR